MNGERLQLFKQNADKTYAKTVNNVAIDKNNGNISLDASKIPYGDSTVKAVLDDLNYVKVQINSMSNNVNTAEKGAKVRAVTVSWALNNAVITGAALNGTALTETEWKAGKKDFSYPEPAERETDTAITANTTFTLVATDNRDATASRSTSISFKNGKYYGVGNPADEDAINNDFIKGLTKSLVDNFRGDFTVNATDGKYIFFAFPSSFGTPAFVVGGFEGGFAKVKTFDFTNASGFTESYDVYQSANANLGQTTVTVK